MFADSPLEIFTTAIGWYWYDVIWDVLVSCGVAFIPFIVMLLTTWRESFVDGGSEGGATRGVRSLEMQVYIALTVILLAGVPSHFTPISLASMTFQPTPTVLNSSPTPTTSTSTDTTYASGFAGSPTDANVPVWWFGILRLSAGIQQAIVAGASPSISGLRQFQEQVKLASIKRPEIRREAQRFYAECYVPARSIFLRDATSPAASAAIASWGNDDTEWIGSHAFRDDPALYASLYAASELPGWTFSSSDPSAADVAGDPGTPDWARPSCKDWWEEPSIGLRAKIVNDANVSATVDGNTLSLAITKLFGGWSSDKNDDSVAQAALQAEGPLFEAAKPSISTLGEAAATATKAAGTGANTISATIAWVLNWLAMGVIVPGMQFLQPLLLMGIYALLPLYLVIARYDWSVLLVGAIAIFSIKFWTVLWVFVRWLDERLIVTFYPGADSIWHLWGLSPTTFLVDGVLAKRAVLDLVIASLYVALPALWSSMLVWAGLHLADGASQALSLNAASMRGASQIPLLGKFLGGVKK